MINLEDLTQLISSFEQNEETIIPKRKDHSYKLEMPLRKDNPYIELTIKSWCREWGVLSVEDNAGFFPGYRKQFLLLTDVKPFVIHLTSSPEGTKIGENKGEYLGHPRHTEIDSLLLQHAPDSSHRIRGSFKRWYEAHPLPEADEGSKVKVYRSPSGIYRLEL